MHPVSKMAQILRQIIGSARLVRVLVIAVLAGLILQPAFANRALALDLHLESIDGFYAGHFKGVAGEGYAMFVFRDGQMAGVDAGGVLFNGIYYVTVDDTVDIRIKIKVPADIPLIFGVNSPASGLNFERKFKISIDEFRNKEFRVFTPLGPVKVRMVRTGDL